MPRSRPKSFGRGKCNHEPRQEGQAGAGNVAREVGMAAEGLYKRSSQ
jgi:hypothetical protein